MTRFAPTLLVFAALAIAAPVPKEKGEKGLTFPTAVGTKWEYIVGGDPKRVDEYEVTSSEVNEGATTFKVNCTAAGGGMTFEVFRIDSEGQLTVVENSSAEFSPPRLMAKAGMKAGDEYTSKWLMKTLTGKVSDAEYVLAVGEAEEIETAAGKFRAVPVKRSFKPKDNNPDTHWYADGVGLVRRTIGPKNQPLVELKAFAPGKK